RRAGRRHVAPDPRAQRFRPGRRDRRLVRLRRLSHHRRMTYHEGSRELQDRFDTRRLADRLDEVKVRDTISAHDRAFIEACDMLFLATADADGRPQCSYKGGAPGFVHVLDERTVAFPNY